MKKSIVKHIALGILASAILTACGGGGSSDTNGGKQVCEFTLQGADPLNINLGQSYVEPGFTIKDGNNNAIQGTTTGNVNSSVVGVYTLTYGAESCSNTATRTVKVSKVAGACSFTLNGANPLTMTVGSNYQELGASITDANNQKVTGTVTGTVNNNTVGNYTLTYQSESCTNTTTRTVNVVQADCTYTMKGENPLMLDKGDVFSEPGVTARDVKNQDANITVTGTVDTSKLGNSTLTYQGAGCANKVTRTVTVKKQTCDIALKGDSPLEVIVGNVYADPGAEIKDKAGNVLVADLKGTGSVDATKVGEYVVSYGHDACGNSSDRIVKVRVITPDELKEVILP